ncbi:MAG: hypothetical protein DRJ47_10080 [Thermoprotei archaeon]|nr:MAG: hypothetical protein DRJ47_10080 [Thermoprotei archaeon]
MMIYLKNVESVSLKKVLFLLALLVILTCGVYYQLVPKNKPKNFKLPFILEKDDILIKFVNFSIAKSISYDYSNASFLTNKNLIQKDWSADTTVRQIKAGSESKLVIIFIEFENLGKRAHHDDEILYPLMKIKTDDGKLYTTDYFVKPNYIKPNETITRLALFKIPKESTLVELIIYEKREERIEGVFVIKLKR